MPAGWLSSDESRIGLGCMRLSTDPDREDARAIATVHAALDAGATVFDTARAYALDDTERGHNERLLARALASHPRGDRARVVTKCGMARPGGAWRPDGRARSIVADCEESLRALGGRPIDLLLLHAPDPRIPFATSLRALASLVDRGLARRVGVCNVNRSQLDAALDLAPLAAVEVALGAGDAEALRGGVVSMALERGLWVLAHAPFGGPARAPRLARDPALAAAAERLGATPAQAVLAWLLALHPRIVALPGSRQPQTARDAQASARIVPDDDARAILEERLGSLQPPRRAPLRPGVEVVLIAGISGAGKSTLASRLATEGYARLNRDERGGTLAAIAAALEDPTRLSPRVLLTQTRQRELPEVDEGFDSIERIAFERRPDPARQGAGLAVAFEALGAAGSSVLDRGEPGPRLVFAWLPGGNAALSEATRGLPVETAACTHPAGPPRCWCRPPLPGLVLDFARRHRIDPARLAVVGTSATHRKLASAIGAPFLPAL